MATDILLGGDDGNTIVLESEKLDVKGSADIKGDVRVGGRVRLPILSASTPPAEGQVGDLVLTLEEGEGFGGTRWAKAHLWVCVPSEGSTMIETTLALWREVALGDVVVGG